MNGSLLCLCLCPLHAPALATGHSDENVTESSTMSNANEYIQTCLEGLETNKFMYLARFVDAPILLEGLVIHHCILRLLKTLASVLSIVKIRDSPTVPIPMETLLKPQLNGL